MPRCFLFVVYLAVSRCISGATKHVRAKVTHSNAHVWLQLPLVVVVHCELLAACNAVDV
jgi:hypothetical protein